MTSKLLSVTPDVGNLSSEFELCKVFRFQVIGRHGTDGRRDG